MSGKHVTGTVSYGYLWDEKRENWIVDPEAAEVVKQIFNLTMEDYGPYQIARQLKEQEIEIPTVHLARYNEGVNRTKPVKDPCGWCSSTIVQILKKREYLGHTVNFKTRKKGRDRRKESRHPRRGYCQWRLYPRQRPATAGAEEILKSWADLYASVGTVKGVM